MAMNAQVKRRGGKVVGRGIQWCTHTWNAIGGCQHACRWKMPDGSIAICYAEEIANKFTRAYPDGFEHHYWRPAQLVEPSKLQQPAKIFLDSMSDLMGANVPAEQIEQVLQVARDCAHHVFQVLTKNPARLTQFAWPDNVWVGVSSPPDFMKGSPLTHAAQEKMLAKSLRTLDAIEVPVTWMSVEPLSWDVSRIIADNPPLKWAVIGAATNGPKVYQPDPNHVRSLLDVFDAQRVPVFFKGNIWGNAAITEWREYFPGYEPSEYLSMELGRHAVPV